MKKIYTYLTMAFIALVTFTSCEVDDDSYRARTLDGTWTGYIETYYRDRWGWTGSNYRTTMYFERRGAYGGVGYEVDYNMDNRYGDRYFCEFEWDVYNGEICINYADSYNPVYIYDYDLYDDLFEGYMDDGTNRDIYFKLYYDGNFDWNPYYDYYYYASTRSGHEISDSTIVRGKGFYATGEFAKAIKNKKEASN